MDPNLLSVYTGLAVGLVVDTLYGIVSGLSSVLPR